MVLVLWMMMVQFFIFLGLIFPFSLRADWTIQDYSSNYLPYFNSTFERDLFNLQKGLHISGFAPEIPTDFKNPYYGKTSFMLPEENAPWAGNYFSMVKGGTCPT